jgi:purine-binding chemotaxis protein CheW
VSGESGVPQAAPAASLICEIGGWLLALPLAGVAEIMRPLPIAVFPGTPGFIPGVSTIRGAVVPVIDVGLLLGVGESRPTRFVTLTLEQRLVALAVDAVIGIQTLDDTLHDLPPLLQSVDHETLSAVGVLDAGLLLALDTAHLVPDSVWELLNEQVTAS